MIGLDLQALCDSVFIQGAVHSLPYAPGLPWYTPVAELPESARMLFDYDPEKARKMLADAGYPKDYTVQLEVSHAWEWTIEAGSIIADYWNKIGVKTEVKVLDAAAARSSRSLRKYKDAMLTTEAANELTQGIHKGVNIENPLCHFHDDYAYGQYLQILAEMDPVEQTRLMKDLGVYMVDAAFNIPLGNAYKLNCYWPWLKNYYGETEAAYSSLTPMFSTLWIDQAMKAEMGY